MLILPLASIQIEDDQELQLKQVGCSPNSYLKVGRAPFFPKD
jgi:hypothetical protein